jgi:hypothetical protein
MKRQPIPQFEFGFSGEAFNLANEKQPIGTDGGPKILAEMTAEERERARETAKAFLSEIHREIEAVTMPGLAPGSYWDAPAERKAMAKALSTMQGER